MVLNWKRAIARPVVDNRTACSSDLRLLVRLIMETYDRSHDKLQIATTGRAISFNKSCDWPLTTVTWGTWGRTPILIIQAYISMTGGGTLWNWSVAICSSNSLYADTCKSLFKNTRYHITTSSLLHKQVWCSCGQNACPWVCCLSKWLNLSFIITYNKSNYINIKNMTHIR